MAGTYSTAPKRVAIVGAGPSGLVAAKSLLYDHPSGTFIPTIFEKSQNIGGLWPISREDSDGLINPDMCTNQSRHTVAFSDLAWDDDMPMFPKAWQVGEYLKKYREKYLVPKEVKVWTGWKVVKAVREAEKKWSVTVEEVKSGETETSEFDHLIVASGFFGEPKIPKTSSPTVESGPRIIHSSKFRNVRDLLAGKKPGKIVIVGGQMSGVEVAASVATQLSSEVWSPSGSVPEAEKFEIHHVISRPLWIMPLYLPAKPTLEVSEENSGLNYNPSTPFLPLDLASYDLTKRPVGPLKNTSGRLDAETCIKFNEFFVAKLGGDQSEFADDGLAMRGEITKQPAWLAVSDSYNEFVRSGNIQLHTGRVEDLTTKVSNNGEIEFENVSYDKPSGLSYVTITGTNRNTNLDNVAAIILASGFGATSSISFLPKEILETLQFDPKFDPFPIDLQCHSTVHKDIPDLGFVGFYRSPYWGVMEMQARFLGKLWTGATDISKTVDDTHDISALRKCYIEEPERFAQFPMGDYAYLMESFAGAADIKRLPWPVGENNDTESRTGPVLVQRYSYDSPSNPEISKAIMSIESAFDGSEKGKFVARAVMCALQGRWKVIRRFQSRDSLNPSGNFEGVAWLHPRTPTDSKFDFENLYVEEGNFTTDTGLNFKANRRYVHRYQEATDTLSLWFVKTDDNKSVDYLFHEIEILPSEGDSGWKGKAYHWCEPDKYHVEYEFRFQGVGLKEWRMEYSVKGPKKDYTISSTYTR